MLKVWSAVKWRCIRQPTAVLHIDDDRNRLRIQGYGLTYKAEHRLKVGVKYSVRQALLTLFVSFTICFFLNVVSLTVQCRI